MIVIAEVTFTTEGMAVITVMLGALCATIGKLHLLLIASEKEKLTAMQSQRDSYKEMADEAITRLEQTRDAYFTQSGRVKPEIVAPVVAEHNSPTTREQQEAAEMQTLRARLVAACLHLGLPAREAAPMASEDAVK